MQSIVSSAEFLDDEEDEGEDEVDLESASESTSMVDHEEVKQVTTNKTAKIRSQNNLTENRHQ